MKCVKRRRAEGIMVIRDDGRKQYYQMMCENRSEENKARYKNLKN